MNFTQFSFDEIIKVMANFLANHVKFIGILIITIIIPFIFDKIYGKNARKAREILNNHGFTTLPEVYHKEIISTLSKFSIFNGGRYKEIRNLLLREANIGKVYVFDCSRSAYPTRTVIYFHSDLINLPQFTVEPGGIFAKNIGHVPDYLKFEENPAFNKCYMVWGNNKDEIKKLFNSTVMTFFLENKGFHAAGDKDKLIVYRSDVVKSDNIGQFLEKSTQFFYTLKS